MNFLISLKDWWWKTLTFKAKLVSVGVLITVIGLIVLFSQIDSCKSEQTQQKIEDNKEKVVIGKTEANSIANSANAAKTDVNILANNSNLALSNANHIRNSNLKNVNLSEAERLRCSAYPEDCK